jgi:hypothetical protein
MRGWMKSTKDDQFTKRLAETMDSELDPELITPMTAGAEELPQYQKTFPLTCQFKRSSGTGTYSLNTNFKNEGDEE